MIYNFDEWRMKRKKVGIGAGILLAGLSAIVCGYWILPLKQEEPPKQTDRQEFGRAAKDNPQARLDFEIMRRADPASGVIPADMRTRELAFAATLPTDNSLQPLSSAKRGGDRILSVQWQRRGPFNVGGRTRALAVDVSDENVLLAGGVSGGMWRSTDGGQSWTKRTLPTDLHNITCIAQDTREGRRNIWYYGTGEWRGNSASGQGATYRGDGIFKSVDGGLTWKLLPATSTDRPSALDNVFDFVWTIAVDTSSAEERVYAATFGGIQRSSDGGASWSSTLGQLVQGPNTTDVAVNELGHVYATASSGNDHSGIWRSEDGIEWESITPQGWPGRYSRVVIGMTPFYDEMYFFAESRGFGFNNHSLWKLVYRDGGRSIWDDRSANLPNFGSDFGTINTQFAYDMVIKVHPEDDQLVFLGGRNLYRTTNGFMSNTRTSWIGGYNPQPQESSTFPNHHPDQHALAFMPSNPNVMLSGNDGGVYRTMNNRAKDIEWESLNRGYYTTQFYALAIDPATAGDPVIIGGTQDNGTHFVNSANADAAWLQIFGSDGGFCEVAKGRAFYYVSIQNGEIHYLRLGDDGTRQTSLQLNPAGVEPGQYLFINPYTMDPNRNEILYMVTRSALWRNNPIGQPNGRLTKWDRLNNTTPNDGRITAVTACTTPADRVYFGSSGGSIFRIENAAEGDPQALVVRNSDEDESIRGYANCIAVDPADGDKLLIAYSNYRVESLFYSSDAGASWTAVSGNLEEDGDPGGDGPSVSWACILPTENGTAYFAATSIGLFATNQLNGSETRWVQQGADVIGNVVIDMVRCRAADGLVAVGSHGSGIFSGQVTNEFFETVSAVDEVNETAVGLRAWPNPFSDRTTLEFRLAEPGPLSVQLYAPDGRLLRTILSKAHQPAGEHRIEIAARDERGQALMAGVYICRLILGDHSQSIKLVLYN